MEKIVLFTFVFLAAVAMINCAYNTTSVATPTATVEPAATQTVSAPNATTTVGPATLPTTTTTTTAASAIQPLAMFVLLCAFLGLMH